MPLDAEARMILDLMKQSGRPPLETLSGKDGRAQADPLSANAEADAPEVARVENGHLIEPGGNIAFRSYWPNGATAKILPTLIYYHGGGFVIGNLETHDSTCRRLANKSQCQVIAIDYRLAPEHPFPAAVDDAIAAFRHIRDHAATFATAPDKLAVGGDSAGGTLSAVVCQAMKEAKQQGPAFQMLIYPGTDFLRATGSRKDNGEGYFLTQALIDWFFKHYVPKGVDLRDPRISPLLTDDFSGLPPAYVLTAGYDPLRDEGRAYADRLLDAGVRTTYSNFPGTIHAFFSMTRFLPQGLKANDEAAYALRAHFGLD